MHKTVPPSQQIGEYLVAYNQVSIEYLFDQYQRIGFLYPAKKALLSPHFDQIKSNWEKMLASKEELLWILTKEDEIQNDFASVSVWKQSNRGMLAQHLVSSGNPFLSLKLLLAAQYKAEHLHGPDEVASSQNWFRPNNRYAFKVFASMIGKLGSEYASLIRFQYLHVPLDLIPQTAKRPFIVEEVTHLDPELVRFVEQEYNSIFVRGEELDQEDVNLKAIGNAYESYGLKRSRKILKFIEPFSGDLCGCVIANRAPLGLNFSFLENRAYFLVEQKLDEHFRKQLVLAMHKAIRSYYENFALQAIPTVTDECTSRVLQAQGASLIREYMQSIWLRAGFSKWYEHIGTFLHRIEARQRMRSTV